LLGAAVYTSKRAVVSPGVTPGSARRRMDNFSAHGEQESLQF